jgi:selenoprotein W-related protein
MEHSVVSLHIVPSAGGVFEVTIDGTLIFSKKQLKRHANPGEIMSLIRNR